MFRVFRQLLGAVQEQNDRLEGVSTRIGDIADTLGRLEGQEAADGHLEARVADLERSVHGQLAEAEAILTRAESTLKAARAAEQRERHHRQKAEEAEERAADRDEGGEDPFLRAARELREGDAEGGQGEGVSPVHPGVEVGVPGAEAALRAKYGG